MRREDRPMAKAVWLALAFCAAVSALLLLNDGPGWHYGYTYEKDELQTLCQIRAIMETGNQLTPTRLNAGHGDWRDFPMHLPVESTLVSVLVRLGFDPMEAASLDWSIMVGLTAALAFLAFTELALPPPTAFVLGVLYAVQTYTWEHNLWHWHLHFAWIPGAAVVLLNLFRGQVPGSRWLHVNLFLLGISSLYYSFFFLWLLAVALIPGLRHGLKARSPLFRLLLCFGLGLSLQLAMCLRHADRPAGQGQVISTSTPGRNPADSEHYSLRLRQLLAPRPNHPLRPWNRLEDRLEVSFDRRQRDFDRDQTEATRGRLGTLASLGLVLLFGWYSWRGRCAWAPAAAGLSLAVLLIGLNGGLGAVFNAVVFTGLRCYNRMLVFLSFFCLAAAGLLLQRMRWAVILLLPLGCLDQHEPVAAYTHGSVPDLSQRIEADRAWVKEVESALPAGSLVFQLPPHLAMANADYALHREYDHAIGYLFSRSLCWSWGYLPGFQQERWDRLSQLTPREQLKQLHGEGFAAVWLDRYGYVDDPNHWEWNLRHHLGVPVKVSANGRYELFSLREPQSADLAEFPPENEDGARIRFHLTVSRFSALRQTLVELRVPLENRSPFALSGAGKSGRRLAYSWVGSSLPQPDRRTTLPLLPAGESMEVPMQIAIPDVEGPQRLQISLEKGDELEVSGPELQVDVRRW